MRHDGRLYHISLGRTYAGTYVRLLVQDLDITIVDTATGELLRDLALGRAPGACPRDAQGWMAMMESEIQEIIERPLPPTLDEALAPLRD